MPVETKIKPKKIRRLNVQAMAVREHRVVGGLVADEGRTFVACDIISAEPVISAMISQDPYYKYAVYEGVGKDPFWHKGVLMIADVYLMYASVCPITASKIKEKFDPEEWKVDPEAVKKKLKAERSICKVVVLAGAYGVGVDKLHTIFREAGYTITKEEVRQAHAAYWELFSKIKKSKNGLTKLVERDGYLINWFGFKATPRKAVDGFNLMAQSTVAGMMGLYLMLLFKQIKEDAVDALFVSQIHDAIILDVVDEDIEKFKVTNLKAIQQFNDEMQWELKMRTDYNSGKSFKDLK